MKKIIVLGLALIMAILCLTACGDKVSKVTISGTSTIAGSSEVNHYETVYYKVNGTMMTEEEYEVWSAERGR